ncbi:MAG: response regulator transcription factor [Thermodesulfobacteriota bacterium]
MKEIRILIAEDDRNIAAGLVDTLESEGYRATAVHDGEQALKALSAERFDLILLDIMMPGKSGYDVCRAIRTNDRNLPVIMLTAKGEEIDKVLGLELGADDYVTKPFGVRELLARISAVLRRSERDRQSLAGNENEPAVFLFGEAEVNSVRYRVTLRGKTARLSSRELKLLRYFLARPNEVISRDHLLNAIWGIDYFGTTRTLDQHIAQLRKKIEPDPGRPSVITTVHGVGYRYERADEPSPGR